MAHRKATGVFKSITRAQHEESFKNRTDVPPPGAYSPRHNYLKGGSGPSIAYGPQSTWDGHLKKRSEQIKVDNFEKNTQVCPRVMRVLTKYRDHQVKSFNKIIK